MAKKGAELTFGGYNPARVNTVNYYSAYDYNGNWEVSINTVGYKGKAIQIFERRGLFMVNVPFIIIPWSNALLRLIIR